MFFSPPQYSSLNIIVARAKVRREDLEDTGENNYGWDRLEGRATK